jgi:NAD(P)H-hydrate epimerase
LGVDTASVQSNRPKALVELSRRLGTCWVVLKGYQTIIGRDTGSQFINSTGNPMLAQGGSGDVLAGYLAGWLAQPCAQADPLLALRYGVWEHGAAADFLSARFRGWTVDDLVRVLGNRLSN